jgi:hypothetical protein
MKPKPLSLLKNFTVPVASHTYSLVSRVVGARYSGRRIGQPEETRRYGRPVDLRICARARFCESYVVATSREEAAEGFSALFIFKGTSAALTRSTRLE